MSSPAEFKAVLRGGTPPGEAQRERLLAFLRKTYGGEFTLEWIQDESVRDGFVLEAGADVQSQALPGGRRHCKAPRRGRGRAGRAARRPDP